MTAPTLKIRIVSLVLTLALGLPGSAAAGPELCRRTLRPAGLEESREKKNVVALLTDASPGNQGFFPPGSTPDLAPSLQPAAGLEEAPAWITRELWEELAKANLNTPPFLVQTKGSPEAVRKQINERLAELPAATSAQLDALRVPRALRGFHDPYIALQLQVEHHNRVDHVLVIDRDGHLSRGDRISKITDGKVDLDQYEFGFFLSEYPSRRAVHFHAITLGRELSLRGKGMGSATFRKIADKLRQDYPGYKISAVTAAFSTERWFQRYFRTHHAAPEEFDFISSYTTIPPADWLNLRIGEIPPAAGLEEQYRLPMDEEAVQRFRLLVDKVQMANSRNLFDIRDARVILRPDLDEGQNVLAGALVHIARPFSDSDNARMPLHVFLPNGSFDESRVASLFGGTEGTRWIHVPNLNEAIGSIEVTGKKDSPFPTKAQFDITTYQDLQTAEPIGIYLQIKPLRDHLPRFLPLMLAVAASLMKPEAFSDAAGLEEGVPFPEAVRQALEKLKADATLSGVEIQLSPLYVAGIAFSDAQKRAGGNKRLLDAARVLANRQTPLRDRLKKDKFVVETSVALRQEEFRKARVTAQPPVVRIVLIRPAEMVDLGRAVRTALEYFRLYKAIYQIDLNEKREHRSPEGEELLFWKTRLMRDYFRSSQLLKKHMPELHDELDRAQTGIVRLLGASSSANPRERNGSAEKVLKELDALIATLEGHLPPGAGLEEGPAGLEKGGENWEAHSEWEQAARELLAHVVEAHNRNDFDRVLRLLDRLEISPAVRRSASVSVRRFLFEIDFYRFHALVWPHLENLPSPGALPDPAKADLRKALPLGADLLRRVFTAEQREKYLPWLQNAFMQVLELCAFHGMMSRDELSSEYLPLLQHGLPEAEFWLAFIYTALKEIGGVSDESRSIFNRQVSVPLFRAFAAYALAASVDAQGWPDPEQSEARLLFFATQLLRLFAQTEEERARLSGQDLPDRLVGALRSARKGFSVRPVLRAAARRNSLSDSNFLSLALKGSRLLSQIAFLSGLPNTFRLVEDFAGYIQGGRLSEELTVGEADPADPQDPAFKFLAAGYLRLHAAFLEGEGRYDEVGDALKLADEISAIEGRLTDSDNAEVQAELLSMVEMRDLSSLAQAVKFNAPGLVVWDHIRPPEDIADTLEYKSAARRITLAMIHAGKPDFMISAGLEERSLLPKIAAGAALAAGLMIGSQLREQDGPAGPDRPVAGSYAPAAPSSDVLHAAFQHFLNRVGVGEAPFQKIGRFRQIQANGTPLDLQITAFYVYKGGIPRQDEVRLAQTAHIQKQFSEWLAQAAVRKGAFSTIEAAPAVSSFILEVGETIDRILDAPEKSGIDPGRFDDRGRAVVGILLVWDGTQQKAVFLLNGRILAESVTSVNLTDVIPPERSVPLRVPEMPARLNGLGEPLFRSEQQTRSAGLEERSMLSETAKSEEAENRGISGRGVPGGVEVGVFPTIPTTGPQPQEKPRAMQLQAGSRRSSPLGNIRTLNMNNITSTQAAANFVTQGMGLKNRPVMTAAGSSSLNTSMIDRAMNSSLLSDQNEVRMPSTIVENISGINNNPSAGLEETPEDRAKALLEKLRTLPATNARLRSDRVDFQKTVRSALERVLERSEKMRPGTSWVLADPLATKLARNVDPGEWNTAIQEAFIQQVANEVREFRQEPLSLSWSQIAQVLRKRSPEETRVLFKLLSEQLPNVVTSDIRQLLSADDPFRKAQELSDRWRPESKSTTGLEEGFGGRGWTAAPILVNPHREGYQFLVAGYLRLTAHEQEEKGQRDSAWRLRDFARAICQDETPLADPGNQERIARLLAQVKAKDLPALVKLVKRNALRIVTETDPASGMPYLYPGPNIAASNEYKMAAKEISLGIIGPPPAAAAGLEEVSRKAKNLLGGLRAAPSVRTRIDPARREIRNAVKFALEHVLKEQGMISGRKAVYPLAAKLARCVDPKKWNPALQRAFVNAVMEEIRELRREPLSLSWSQIAMTFPKRDPKETLALLELLSERFPKAPPFILREFLKVKDPLGKAQRFWDLQNPGFSVLDQHSDVGVQIAAVRDRVRAELKRVPLSATPAVVGIGPTQARQHGAMLQLLGRLMPPEMRGRIFVLTSDVVQARRLEDAKILATTEPILIVQRLDEEFVPGGPVRIDYHALPVEQEDLLEAVRMWQEGRFSVVPRGAESDLRVFLQELLANLMGIKSEQVPERVNIDQLTRDIDLLLKA